MILLKALKECGKIGCPGTPDRGHRKLLLYGYPIQQKELCDLEHVGLLCSE